MLDKDFFFSLSKLIEKSVTLLSERNADEVKGISDRVYLFLQNRIAYLLSEKGFSKDVIAAIISVSADHVPNIWNRARALEKLKAKPDFEPLAIAFKRVVNIIKQAAPVHVVDIDESLFQHECESNLYAAYRKVKEEVSDNLDNGFFERALLDIASLRDPIDAFFDGVMVMAEDEAVRGNRLSQLQSIADLFALFADFSKI
jgi:glycyl-tRNA synthetase beta chain